MVDKEEVCACTGMTNWWYNLEDVELKLCFALYCEIQVLYLFWPLQFKKDTGTLNLPQECND